MPEPFSRFLADTNRRFEENQRRFQEMWNKHLWDDDIISDMEFRDRKIQINDRGVINMVDDDTKMEISLNTSGYKPGELSVNVTDGQLIIEGKHEEKTESGHTMVSRHFRRQYGLSPNVKMTEVVSNLSQDGVLVVTVPKEKKSSNVLDNKTTFQDTLTSSKTSFSSFRNLNDDFWEPRKGRWSDKSDAWFDKEFEDMKMAQNDYLDKSLRDFEENLTKLRKNFDDHIKMFDKDFKLSLLNLKDEHELKVVSDNNKLEISLDTSGYKPDELKVTAGQGVICVEAKHEERTEAGDVMVSRHMSRVYPLPSNAQPEDVHSNLSKNGVLVISVPKSQQIQQQFRNIPIEIN